MVEENHEELSVAEQCRFLGLHQCAYYYERSDRRHDEDLDDLKLILVVLSSKTFYGYRKVARELLDRHSHLTGKEIRYPNQVWATDVPYIRLPGGFVFAERAFVATIQFDERDLLCHGIEGGHRTVRGTGDLQQRPRWSFAMRTARACIRGSQFTSDAFCNRMRRHSALGKLAPPVFAENYLSERRSV